MRVSHGQEIRARRIPNKMSSQQQSIVTEHPSAFEPARAPQNIVDQPKPPSPIFVGFPQNLATIPERIVVWYYDRLRNRHRSTASLNRDPELGAEEYHYELNSDELITVISRHEQECTLTHFDDRIHMHKNEQSLRDIGYNLVGFHGGSRR